MTIRIPVAVGLFTALLSLAASAALLVGLTTIGGTASGKETDRDKPNVVVLFIDDLGWKDLGVYGSKFFETPRIDRLAKQGALFTRAYSSCNVCSPTRASLLTGKYPQRIGFTNWLNPRKPNGPNSAVNIIYYMGDQDRPPKALVNHLKGTFGGIRNYVLLEGEKGLLSTGMWGKICYVKMDGDKKFISHGKHPEARKIAQSLPRVDSHFGEWTDAILDGGETFSPFEVGGHLTEIGLVGNVALRLQKNLDWDGEAMKAKGMPEADALIRKQNRTKWL